MAAKKKPLFRTPDEKRAIVDAYFSRGKRSGREVAEELGVPAQMIYNWRHKIEQGESLGVVGVITDEQPKMTRAIDRARAAIIAAKDMKDETAATNGKQREFLFEEMPSSMSIEIASLKQERDHLKQEVARLKRMLATYLEDH